MVLRRAVGEVKVGVAREIDRASGWSSSIRSQGGVGKNNIIVAATTLGVWRGRSDQRKIVGRDGSAWSAG